MLIVRGVNVFPTALREIVNAFRPHVSGVISIRPARIGPKQEPPLRVIVELAEGGTETAALAEQIRTRIREVLIAATEIVLAPNASLPRSSYKSHLVDWSEAKE
jgi:phenylacetate-CoA ligase